MKKEQKRSEASVNGPINGDVERTVFEQVMDIVIELRKSAGLPVDHVPAASKSELPKWCSGIFERFRRTILKPILKLRPNGVMNWRNYGTMIGIAERYKTFITHDIEREFVEAGFDKITDEQWERIRPMLGEDKLRVLLVINLGRLVADDEPLEKLIDEAWERQLAALEKLRKDAFWLVAQQDAKVTTQFFKGMSKGYTCFVDERGRFAGDRGRTRLYYEFLAYRLEIEQFRRTTPVKTRRDFQTWVINIAKIPVQNDAKWFDHFCEEICLSMKGVGRKPKPQIL